MYEVSETYHRFDQKNNMLFRPHWDSSMRHLGDSQRHKTQLRHIEEGVTGFALKDFALADAGSVVATTLGTGINRPNSGLTSWQKLPADAVFRLAEMPEMPAVGEVPAMTAQIKRVASYFGADLVGIAKLDWRWLYSHHYIPGAGESQPVEIDQRYRYVVAMALGMDYNMVRLAPSALYHAEVMRTYSKMAFLVSAVARFIRQLGYHAIPSLNDTGLNIPIAIDAGLGRQGRNGLLVSPRLGPRQRLCKVITDLPLQPDHPIDGFGIPEFCSVCRKCAQKCPAQALSYGEPTAEVSSISNNPGVVKWQIAAEKCWEYRLSKYGTVCGICIRVCPFNKGKGWIHGVSRCLVKGAPRIDPLMLWMDDLMGYGKHLSARLFWNNKI